MPNTAQFSPFESLSIEAACAALSTVLLMRDEASNIGHPPLTGNVISQAFMRIEQDYGRMFGRKSVHGGSSGIIGMYRARPPPKRNRRAFENRTALAKLTPYERELLRIE